MGCCLSRNKNLANHDENGATQSTANYKPTHSKFTSVTLVKEELLPLMNDDLDYEQSHHSRGKSQTELKKEIQKEGPNTNDGPKFTKQSTFKFESFRNNQGNNFIPKRTSCEASTHPTIDPTTIGEIDKKTSIGEIYNDFDFHTPKFQEGDDIKRCISNDFLVANQNEVSSTFNQEAEGKQNLSTFSEDTGEADPADHHVSPRQGSSSWPYLSINSVRITGRSSYSHIADPDCGSEFSGNIDSFENVFAGNYVFFYFEISHFIFYERDYLLGTYPDINLIMVIEINDNKESQEKIIFTRAKENEKELASTSNRSSSPIYEPLRNKYDLIDPKNTDNSYRVAIPIEDTLERNGVNNVWKIGITFNTYTNHKQLICCNDEIFIKVQKENEMKKFKMYKNFYMKHYGKKIGNLVFDYAYKSAEISKHEIDMEKNIMLRRFHRCEDIATYEEFPLYVFYYYRIQNCILRENGSSNGENKNNKDNKEGSNTSTSTTTATATPNIPLKGGNDYLSIAEIDDLDEFRGEFTLDKLLKLLENAKKKYELYQVLKRISYFFSTKEFREDKMIYFKELLIKRMYDFTSNKDINDKILIPFIFNMLKTIVIKDNAFTYGNGGKRSRRYMGKDSSVTNSTGGGSYVKIDPEKILEFNNQLMIEFFGISFDFLRTDIPEDIALSALNYISKHLDETTSVKVNNKFKTGAEYFYDVIIQRKLYMKLWDIFTHYYAYQACVQPIFDILVRITNMKNPRFQDLYDNISSSCELMKKVVKIHDCNLPVMANVFYLLINTSDRLDLDYYTNFITVQRLKEIFNIFKITGFEIVHDAILQFFKNYLQKKKDPSYKRCITTGINDSMMSSSHSGSKGDPNDFFSDEEYVDIIIMFSYTLQLLKTRIKLMELDKLARWIYNYLNYIYTFCSILNSISLQSGDKLFTLLIERKIVENLIECLEAMNEGHIFESIDIPFKCNVLDQNLINIKILIFRAMYHSLMLISTMKNMSSHALGRMNSEKLMKVIDKIKENEKLHPKTLQEALDKTVKSNSNSEIINTYNSLRNLKEYYLRYKSKAEEIQPDLLARIGRLSSSKNSATKKNI